MELSGKTVYGPVLTTMQLSAHALRDLVTLWSSAKLCGVEQRVPPMFGRVTITLGIGLHSSYYHYYYKETRMWANAQRDGRPAERRWRAVFNAAKFG